MELRGLEPLTPTLPVWCATSCATAPSSSTDHPPAHAGDDESNGSAQRRRIAPLPPRQQRSARRHSSSPITGVGRLPALCSTSRQPSVDLLQHRPAAVRQAAHDRPPVHREVEQGADRGPCRAAVGDHDERLPRRDGRQRVEDGRRHPGRDVAAALGTAGGDVGTGPPRGVRVGVHRPDLADRQALPAAAVRLAQPFVLLHLDTGEPGESLGSLGGPTQVGGDDRVRVAVP